MTQRSEHTEKKVHNNRKRTQHGCWLSKNTYNENRGEQRERENRIQHRDTALKS